jgi:hypothetical protein
LHKRILGPGALALLAALTPSAPALASDKAEIKAIEEEASQQGAFFSPVLMDDLAADASNSAQAVELDVEEQAESEQPEWAGTLEIYGFAPLRSKGTTTVNGRDGDFDLDLGDILDDLEGAFFVRGSVERDRLGLQTDLSYQKLGDKGASTGAGGLVTGKAQVDFDQGIYDLALRYRFGDQETAIAEPGSYAVIPYLGVRVLDIESELEIQLRGTGPRQPTFERSGGFDRTWAQPLVGVRGSYFFTPKLRVFARADIAGFGISGDKDLSGNVQVGLGYAVGNNTDINISYRYQGLRYDDGKNSESGLSMDNNGIELGVKFYF